MSTDGCTCGLNNIPAGSHHQDTCPLYRPLPLPLRLPAKVGAHLDEVAEMSWSPAQKARRANRQSGAIHVQAVLDAVEQLGLSTEDGLDYPTLITLLGELKMRRDDHTKLHDWLGSHTKVHPAANSVDAAINLLDTARLMVAHLTPAVTSILRSALSALESAGVDVGILVVPDPPKDPSLGLATTEQLLHELRARGDVDTLTLEDDIGKRRGEVMAGAAQALLNTLPPEVLAYRTVDES